MNHIRKIKSIQIKEGDILRLEYLDSDNKVYHAEEVTIKSIKHYNGDLYLVEFKEKQGSYALNIQQLYAMKVNKQGDKNE